MQIKLITLGREQIPAASRSAAHKPALVECVAFQRSLCDSIKTKTATGVGAVIERRSLSPSFAPSALTA